MESGNSYSVALFWAETAKLWIRTLQFALQHLVHKSEESASSGIALSEIQGGRDKKWKRNHYYWNYKYTKMFVHQILICWEHRRCLPQYQHPKSAFPKKESRITDLSKAVFQSLLAVSGSYIMAKFHALMLIFKWSLPDISLLISGLNYTLSVHLGLFFYPQCNLLAILCWPESNFKFFITQVLQKLPL